MVGDVFYLTCAEVLTPPPDVRTLVERRWAERRRLQELSLPEMFDGQWTPVVHAEPPAISEIVKIIEAPAAQLIPNTQLTTSTMV